MKKFQIYTMRGNDITVEADSFVFNKDARLVEFIRNYKTFCVMISSNIIGIEEI